MARARKQAEPEEEIGAPDWMVTFSDCMTLLLTFFVLLLSFSSFDDVEDLFRLKSTFEKEFSYSPSETETMEAFLAIKLLTEVDDIDDGSEVRSLTKKKEEGTAKRDNEAKDFRGQNIFLSASEDIFWGKGAVLSLHGQKTLSEMASFLKKLPSRVVISENLPDGLQGDGGLGLKRSWAVIEYLVSKHGLDRGQFSIAAGTLQKRYGANSRGKANRTLEIVLLERSIYN